MALIEKIAAPSGNRKEPQGTKHPAALSSGRKKAAKDVRWRLFPCSRPFANLLGAPPDGSIPKPTLAKSFDFINSE
jgi:hypothetical protein